MKSIFNGKKTLIRVVQARSKSTISQWSLPEILQKLKFPIPIPDIYPESEEILENSDIDHVLGVDYKEPSLKYVYVSSEKTVASIQNRAIALLNSLRRSGSLEQQLEGLDRLVDHMKMYPVTRSLVRREGGISSLLTIRENTRDDKLKRWTKGALTLLGYADPVKEFGVRILTLDGGGTRGVISIEILKRLEELTGQRVHEMFDMIVGTSTGALLAFLLAIERNSLNETMKLYDRLSAEVFEKSTVFGAGKLFFTHAFYETEKLVNILKAEVGDNTCMIDTAFDSRIPKVAAVSTLVNHQVLQPYVFRNYCVSTHGKDNYLGSSKHKLWEALQASSAAPGFFEECKLGPDIHQDGGLLTNNPSALAIHESKLLWPRTPLQTLVSIGNGVYHGRSGPHTASFTSLRAKLMKVVASATDVEAVHITLQDLLPKSSYFRFNPNISVDVAIDESNSDILKQVKKDTRNYIEKYDWKYRKAAEALMKRKTSLQYAKEQLMLRLEMR